MTARFLFILLSIISLQISAQNTRIFEDELGVQGRIVFSGLWSDSAMPQREKYDLKWRSFKNDSLITYSAIGSLSEGLLNGKWIWEQAQWNYTVELGTQLEPQFKSVGERYFWDANFKNGKPHGNWSFVLDTVPAVNKRNNNKLLIQTQYVDGHISGKFQVQDNRTDITFSANGECNASGTANGKWIFKSTKDSTEFVEIRNYEQGILLDIEKHKIRNRDTIREFDQIRENKIKLETIKEKGIESGMRLGSINFETDGIDSELKLQFINLYNKYFLAGWKLPIFHAEVKRSAPVFRKIEYPLSKKELSDIEKAKELSSKIKDKK